MQTFWLVKEWGAGKQARFPKKIHAKKSLICRHITKRYPFQRFWFRKLF